MHVLKPVCYCMRAGNRKALYFSSVYFIQFIFIYKANEAYTLHNVWFLGEFFKTPVELATFWSTGVPPTNDTRVAARMSAHLDRWKTLKFSLPGEQGADPRN